MGSIIVHVTGSDAGTVDFYDMRSDEWPPLFRDDDGRIILPTNYCGLRVIGADSFYWSGADGHLFSAENHGKVQELSDHEFYYGIQFTGPIRTCAQAATGHSTEWKFPGVLSYGGNGPMAGAAALTIELGSLSSIEFIDKAMETIELPWIYKKELLAEPEKIIEDFCDRLPGYCGDHQYAICTYMPEICHDDGSLFPNPVPPWVGEEDVTFRVGELDNQGRARRMTLADYQEETTRISARGLMPKWINFYPDGTQTFVNVIYGRGTVPWMARHGLTGEQYQDLFDEHVRHGRYRPRQVETYLQRGAVRYAVVLTQPPERAAVAGYHGLDAHAHQQQFDDLQPRGFLPVTITVTAVDHHPRYAAVYERRNARGLAVRSSLAGPDYQQFVERQVAAGRGSVYLRAWVDDGQVRYTSVFAGCIDPRRQVLRHGLTQTEWAEETKRWGARGFRPTMVSSTIADGHLRFAAVWQRDPRFRRIRPVLRNS